MYIRESCAWVLIETTAANISVQSVITFRIFIFITSSSSFYSVGCYSFWFRCLSYRLQ